MINVNIIGASPISTTVELIAGIVNASKTMLKLLL